MKTNEINGAQGKNGHKLANRLNQREARPGVLVKRVEGEAEQEKDVGRIGVIKQPNEYNSIGLTFTVEYKATDTEPAKTDEACSPFEFIKIPNPPTSTAQ